MHTRTRTEAACLNASVADLHEALGRRLADASGTIRPEHDGGHRYKATDTHFRGLAVEAQTRGTSAYMMADARRHLASLPADRRAQLEREWEDPDHA